ncbi:sulfatase family protein [Phycisphaera mikurensis]|nr:sulfatase [Phycisphaera mikurensis]MBB6441128.1 arylsulfatase A-like enzyme [Phycisphaera mikurensis]
MLRASFFMSKSCPFARNAVWILSDQHPASMLSCAGDPNAATPNLDRLAAEGVRFTRHQSVFPLCCPARGTLLTGRYPHHCVDGHEVRMPPEMPTIAHAFREAGRRTAWFGKWHLDGFHEKTGRAAFHHVPRERRGGFDTWIGYENNNAQFDCHVHGHRRTGDTTEEVERHRLPSFETDDLTDLAIGHLEELAAAGASFFVAISVQPPHDPYTAPADWMRRHRPADVVLPRNVPPIPRIEEQARREIAGANALVENLDHNVGRIREALRRLGLADDTAVVYLSDHGDQHGQHGHFRKCTPYAGSVNVPMIVGGPCDRHYAMPHAEAAPIGTVDAVPTTLGLCGIPKPDAMPGFDFSAAARPGGLARAEGTPPDAALLQYIRPTGHGPANDLPWRGIVTADGWKYASFAGAPYLMFDLDEDPLEMCNLAHHAHAAPKRRELHGRLKALLEEVGDGFALPGAG